MRCIVSWSIMTIGVQIYIKFSNYTQTHENISTPQPFGELPCLSGAAGIVAVACNAAPLRQGSCRAATKGCNEDIFRGKIRFFRHRE